MVVYVCLYFSTHEQSPSPSTLPSFRHSHLTQFFISLLDASSCDVPITRSLIRITLPLPSPLPLILSFISHLDASSCDVPITRSLIRITLPLPSPLPLILSFISHLDASSCDVSIARSKISAIVRTTSQWRRTCCKYCHVFDGIARNDQCTLSCGG